MGNRLDRNSILILLFVIVVGIPMPSVFAQEVVRQDSVKAKVSYHETDSTKFNKDTIQDQNNDISPLDIGGSRGIFILSADQMMQLRILGSIRTSIHYSDQDMKDKQTFNPYEIPTDLEVISPNFFAGLQQTRLGIEVTRRTKTRGDVFIRLEGDFKNSSTTFRIRHAYGQIGRILVGQTWSLMNNVVYQPAIVSLDGPANGSGLRTPQIRYSHTINNNLSWAAAIEYSAPDIEFPDSVSVSLLQVIPNLTGRFSFRNDRLSFRVSGVISTISGRVETKDISYAFGYAGSFAGMIRVSKKGQFYLSFSGGRATSHFLDMFNGNNEDMAYDPNTKTFEALDFYGGYLAYGYTLPKNFSTSISLGMAAIQNTDFQPETDYRYSYNALLNLFWEPVKGARLGIEFANGRRLNKSDGWGAANRISMLMYYDF